MIIERMRHVHRSRTLYCTRRIPEILKNTQENCLCGKKKKKNAFPQHRYSAPFHGSSRFPMPYIARHGTAQQYCAVRCLLYPTVLYDGVSSSGTPRVSRGRSNDATPPINVKPLVTMRSTSTLSSKEPFTNCAAIEPSLPAAATTAIPDTLAAVGNASVETTPNEFQPHVLNALKRHAAVTTTPAPDPDPRAKRVAASAASTIDADNRNFRPTLKDRVSTERRKGGCARFMRRGEHN